MFLKWLELQTVLLEVEGILNSRPISPLYDDEFIQPLTPNHLLFGRILPQQNIRPFEAEIDFNSGKKRVRYIETLVEHFWERWRREYLSTLRNWNMRYKRSNNIIPDVGDIVIIYEEKVPRQNWMIGRIVEILPSRDGQIRGVKVFVGKSKTIIERPVSKLDPIERSCESGETQANICVSLAL